MKITDDKTLRELQDEFSREFPFLKLEFLSNPGSVPSAHDYPKRLRPDLPVGSVRKIHTSGHISLDQKLPPDAIEKTFREIFGLEAKVSRKSFGKWVMTRPSDTRSLKEYNLLSMLTEERAVIV